MTKKQDQKKTDISFKLGASVKKPARRQSVRKLEAYDAVREFFVGLSLVAGDQGVSSGVEPAADMSVEGTSRDTIVALLKEREKPIRLLRTFASVNVVSRQMLAGVQNKVSLYTQLKDLDAKLDLLHSEWLDTCGKTVEDLESQNDVLRPSAIASAFEESGSVLDLVETAFKNIKEKYPEKQVVVDFLDFIDKPLKNLSREQSPSSQKSSVSVHSGKGEEYVRAKLPKLVEEVDSRYKKLKEKFDTVENLSEYQLNQLTKQLEALMSKIDRLSKAY